MNTETNHSPPKLFQAFLLVALAIASLVGGAIAAVFVDGFSRLAVVLSGFGAYIALFAAALRRSGSDWDRWRTPDDEIRSNLRRSSGKRRGGASMRLATVTILPAAAALPLVGAVATF